MPKFKSFLPSKVESSLMKSSSAPKSKFATRALSFLILTLSAQCICIWHLNINTHHVFTALLGPPLSDPPPGLDRVVSFDASPTNLRAAAPVLRGTQAEYTLWSKDETYFEECRNHYVGNETWSQPLGRMVDKIHVKDIVSEFQVDRLKIPQTYAYYDESNITQFTLEAMMALPQPYIIKPAHTSGGVGRVQNNTYQCFKGCLGDIRKTIFELDNPRSFHGGKSNTFQKIQKQLQADLQHDFSQKHNELQYAHIPHRILVEQDILAGGDISNDVSYWYVAHGQPVFVSLQCGQAIAGRPGTTAHRVFVSTNFKRLEMRHNKVTCSEAPPKPSNWEQQVQTVTQLARQVPGIYRLDVYAGTGSSSDVYFSEFTYTTANCADKEGFKPRVADGLLFALEYGQLDASTVTPNFVEQTISNKNWGSVTLKDGIELVPEKALVLPSPIDLCEQVVHRDTGTPYHNRKWEQNRNVQKCLSKAKEVAEQPFRCLVAEDEKPHKYIDAIGALKYPTVQSVLARVDWERAIALLVIIGWMTYCKIGTTPQPNQYLNNVLYLVAMAAVMFWTTPVQGMFSGIPITTVVQESYRAFQIVHPMTSPLIAISHFLTYWFKIASWRSKSLRELLFWQLCVEAISATVNEWAHHTEDSTEVRCMRLAFIGEVKHYVLDDVIRTYVVPPFFVYGWLLPNFVWHWGGLFLAKILPWVV